MKLNEVLAAKALGVVIGPTEVRAGGPGSGRHPGGGTVKHQPGAAGAKGRAMDEQKKDNDDMEGGNPHAMLKQNGWGARDVNENGLVYKPQTATSTTNGGSGHTITVDGPNSHWEHNDAQGNRIAHGSDRESLRRHVGGV